MAGVSATFVFVIAEFCQLPFVPSLYCIVPPDPPDTPIPCALPSYAPLYAVNVGHVASTLLTVCVYVLVAVL